MFVLSFLRQFLLLPLLVILLPTLVIFLGSDTISICFNTVAVLFIIDLDNIVYNTLVPESTIREIAETGRPEIDGNAAMLLRTTKPAHAISVAVTIMMCVSGPAAEGDWAGMFLIGFLPFWFCAGVEVVLRIRARKGKKKQGMSGASCCCGAVAGFLGFIVMFIAK